MREEGRDHYGRSLLGVWGSSFECDRVGCALLLLLLVNVFACPHGAFAAAATFVRRQRRDLYLND